MERLRLDYIFTSMGKDDVLKSRSTTRTSVPPSASTKIYLKCGKPGHLANVYRSSGAVSTATLSVKALAVVGSAPQLKALSKH